MKDTINKLNEIDRRKFLTGAAASTLGVSILPGITGAAESQIINPASHATAKNVIFLCLLSLISDASSRAFFFVFFSSLVFFVFAARLASNFSASETILTDPS